MDNKVSAEEKTFVEVKCIEQVARVTIRRADALNALSIEVLREVRDAFAFLKTRCIGEDAFKDCRAVIVAGEGEKAFVAGADIKVMQGASRSELSDFIGLGQSLMREIELTPLPVIAMVQGFAFGGGLELALACDLIVAGEKAKFGQPEVNLGLIPGFGGTQRLAARCSVGTVKRLVFSGETISAEEALRLGVVDYLFPQAELEAKTLELAQSFTSKSPLAIAAAKRAVEAYFGPQKLAGLTKEVEEFIELFGSADAQEGLAAFIEKRKPEFSGK